MKINLISIEFKNIRSYGNSLTSLNFKKGIHQITGPNGGGKSTLLDVLSYNWYGVPFSKIKIADLINRTNKKGLYTKSVFIIDGTEYKIIRGLKPNILKICKDNKELELLSSKNLIQNEIDDIIGADYILFKQIIALSINSNKPFLTLPANEKRSIVEPIFNIDVFGDMMKVVKKNISELKVNLKIKSTELKSSKETYISLKGQYDDYKITKKNFDSDKEKDLNLLKNKIAEYEKNIQTSKGNIEFGKKEIEKIDKDISDLNDISNRLNDIHDKTSIIHYKKSQIDNEKKFLDENTECSQCGQIIDDEHKKLHLNKINELYKEYKNEQDSLNNEFQKLSEQYDDKQNKLNKKNKLISAIQNEEYKLKLNEDELKKCNKSVNIVNDRKLSFDVSKLKKQLEKKELAYSNLSKEVKEISKEYEQNIIIQDILSEKGAKSHFMKRLLPILNSRISYYLDKFNMPFILTLNETLDEEIISVSGRQTLVPYQSCSMGEKKRFDLSITFAFIDIIKTISGWDCNVLFIDELLDSAVDAENLKLIMKCLNEVFKQHTNSCLYIISHREHDSDIFDITYNISKKGLFSSIKENM